MGILISGDRLQPESLPHIPDAFPILSCLVDFLAFWWSWKLYLKLFCLRQALSRSFPQTNPGLSSQSSQACFPQAVSTAVLLAHPLGAIKHQTASLYSAPRKCLSPFASSNSPHSTLTPSASQGLSSLHLRNFVQRDACMLTYTRHSLS